MTTAPPEIHQTFDPALPVEWIHPHPDNPNEGDEAALAEAVDELGFLGAIFVRQLDEYEFQIIGGEHRWRKAVEAGHTDVPIIRLELTDPEAKRLTLILNETVGEHDVVSVGSLLAQLRADDVDLETLVRGLPYSSAELQHLLSLADEDWERFTGATAPEPPDDDDTRRDVVSFVLDFTTHQHGRFMAKVRRAGPMLGTDDPQVIVKELVKRGFDTL